MDIVIKFRLVQHYLSGEDTQILTIKELQDWSAQHSYDFNVVKQQNNVLVLEGVLRERKKPILCFQIVESDDQCKLV